MDRDLLISRLIDGAAGDAEWAALRDCASRDPGFWSELAEAQRIEGMLRSAVRAESCRADLVELPGTAAEIRAGGSRTAWGLPARLGWAVAACLGLALVGTIVGTRPGSTDLRPFDGGSTAGIGLPAFGTPAEALAAYMDLGKKAGSVVGEMPQRFVLESKPVEGRPGEVEVTFVRQILERAVVRDLYKMGTDENGRSVLVPAAVETPAAPQAKAPL